MKKHLIIGNPIEHSFSPLIHNYWFKKYNINAIYERLALEINEIEKTVNEIKNDNLFAMNVTVPFKKEVLPFIETLSSVAQKTNSVNTICKKNGKIYGDNTDVIGFELAIKNQKINLTNKTALILGAGGVVPSIILALENLGIKRISISNRTKDKIKALKLVFPLIEQVEWGEIGNYDLIINATSVGLKSSDDLEVGIEKIKSGKIFYDLIYNPVETKFLKKAKASGHTIMNGEFMFLYQAQKAFEIWHNILPKIDRELINILRND